MQHYAPHVSSAFEGWYSKFDLPSGSHIILIVCMVPGAKTRPYMVTFRYYPKNGHGIFTSEQWVPLIERKKTAPDHSFVLDVPDFGHVKCGGDGKTEYEFSCEEWQLSVHTKVPEPWSKSKNTPEGWIAYLPLPLHWHVNSLSSPCELRLSIPSIDLPEQDKQTKAFVHQEKNWASSFPSAHIWVQARNHDTGSGICLAGGKILGLEAYILGYRSKELDIDFLPPFSLRIPYLPSLSPLSVSMNATSSPRTFSLTTTSMMSSMKIHASAPADEETWFGLGAPFPEGHRPNFCTESFLATVDVEIWRRNWWNWGAWEMVRRERFEGASLEFAGEYYPGRGEKKE